MIADAVYFIACLLMGATLAASVLMLAAGVPLMAILGLGLSLLCAVMAAYAFREGGEAHDARARHRYIADRPAP